MKLYQISPSGADFLPESMPRLDIRAAESIFGISKVYFHESDEERRHPEYIPSGKPWRTHMIDAIPLPGVEDVKKWAMEQGYHWRIDSPFRKGDHWFAGLTAMGITGCRPDYPGEGETEAEAICRAALKLASSPEFVERKQT